MPMRAAALAALVLTAVASARGEGPRWKAVHSAALRIHDLAVSGPGHAVALAVDGRQPLALATRDGGATWQRAPLPEEGRSLFLLDAANGWAATVDGVLRTTDGGASWSRAARLGGVWRLFFHDARNGWAVGAPKAIWRTADGGVTWTGEPAAAQPPSAPEHSVYHWVDFVTARAGVITGASMPPRKGASSPVPAWRDPRRETRRPEWPALSLVLETRDGGATWKASSASLFGRLTRMRYARDGRGLALVEFHDAFEWPGEVYLVDLRESGKTTRVFRSKDRAVTDALLFPGGAGYLAAIGPGTRRLHILRGLTEWEEMPLPGPVTGDRAMLAAAGPDAIWAAVDSGVILRLEQP